MLPIGDLKEIIISQKLLGRADFEKAFSNSQKQKIPLEEFLVSRKIITQENLYKRAASFYGFPFILLENKVVNSDVLEIIPQNIAAEHQLIAFEKNEGELSIATCLPPNLQIIEFIKRKEDLKINLFFSTPAGINFALNLYRRDIEAEVKKIKFDGSGVNVIEITRGLIENAVRDGASDIHIEPKSDKSLIRYRVDGILREIISFNKELHAGIITRIKILSSLKIDEHRLPQDGRFNMAGPDYKVSVRVSIIPLLEGEKVVLRILRQEAKILTFEELGLQPEPCETVKNEIKKPQGMILVVGPTGCGKTTTLYTILNMLNKPEVNISTIEDPVEYGIPGVNQSQVNPQIGYTFAAGMRSFLRQDPNIIMVGEIRDQETAEIALHAALTGHLVLSTLHTNDAVTTLPRLKEMGIPSYLIASTVNVVIAQRLLRKICPRCKEKVAVPLEKIKKIEKEMGADVKKLLDKWGLSPSSIYRGKGCKFCKFEGLKGRIGIYEVLKNTPEIYSAIFGGASSKEIERAAQVQGMLTMAEDGLLKVFQGITTLEELIRVI